jgi:hypothetical protein
MAEAKSSNPKIGYSSSHIQFAPHSPLSLRGKLLQVAVVQAPAIAIRAKVMAIGTQPHTIYANFV